MRTEQVPIKKHVAMSILLHLCMHETCADVSVYAPEWNYWTIGDAIINYLKKPVASVYLPISQNAGLHFHEHWH